MPSIKNPVVCLFIILFLVSACNREEPKCQFPCIILDQTVYFSGYSHDELDTVRFDKYEPGGSFSNLVTEILLTSPDTVADHPGAYSFTTPGEKYPISLEAGYDYKFYIRSIGQAIHISKMHFSNEIYTASCGKNYTFFCKLYVDSIAGANDSISDPAIIFLKK